MSLVMWIALGALAGFVYSAILSRQAPSYVGGAVLGAFGGLVGGFVFNFAIARGAPTITVWSLLAAMAGALLMLAGFHALRRTGHGV